MEDVNFKTYQSPFSWRYGSDQMRQIFSEENKYKIWRKIWVEIAKAQHKRGLLTDAELKDLEENQDNLDVGRAWEIEKETKHDVVAAIREFAEKAKVGGGKIHLGATSMDIVDNADGIRTKEALSVIEKRLEEILKVLSEKIEKYADFPAIAYTHLQPAEPTTLGYRFALYAQDLKWDLKLLKELKMRIRSKGFKGAVGTAASYQKLFSRHPEQSEGSEEFESEVMEKLGLRTALIAGQTTPRKMDYFVAFILSSIAQSLHKFGFDLRILQSPYIFIFLYPNLYARAYCLRNAQYCETMSLSQLVYFLLKPF